MSDQTHQFLATLLAHVPEQMYAMLWTAQDKKSHWFAADRTEDMAARAHELHPTHDVYAGVSVARQAGGNYRRIEAKAAAGIMGVWADLDIAAPDIHKKWNLPPDEASVRQIMTEAGLEPTILVHSGHGLQAWWLFTEFWEFENEQNRRDAALLSQSWNLTLRVRAAIHDWTVDSTFDLSRVMRVPGTTNHKDTPVPVVLLEIHPDRRYSRDDFDDFIVDERHLKDLGLDVARTYIVGPFQLDALAEPPFEKFDAMRTNDPVFSASWERRRKDLDDQTASTYDLSLASICVIAGWCVDEETEIFTRRGWLTWDQVRPGDETLSIDPESWTADWQTISDVQVFDAIERELIEYSTNNFSAVTTPNHRWLSERFKPWQKSHERRYVTSEAMVSRDRIPRAVETVRPKRETISDSMVEIVAWTYTEGHVRQVRSEWNRSIAIFQSDRKNAANCERIRAALKEEFGDRWTEGSNKYVQVFSVGVVQSAMVLQHFGPHKNPTIEFLDRLTQRQLDIFIEVSLLGDGHIHKTSEYSKHDSRMFFQRTGPRLDSFLAACALAGEATSWRVREGEGNHHGTNPVAHVSVYATEKFAVPRARGKVGRRFIDRRLVWCPTMPTHHNWLARRKGSVYYTGNSDQEIVNLLIASRRHHGDDLKLRIDYYDRTLIKAHTVTARSEAAQRSEEMGDDIKRAIQSGNEDTIKDMRRAAYDSISEQLGVEVVRFIKYLSTPPSYRLEMATCGVDLGDATDILAQPKVNAAILSATNHVVIDPLKPKEYRALVQLMLDACDEIDTGLESTEEGQVYVWISEYLSDRPPLDDADKAAVTEHPYLDRKGQLCIFTSSFRRWLWLSKREQHKAKDLNRVMANVGCRTISPTFVIDEQRTTRAIWHIPTEMMGPARSPREEGKNDDRS